LAFAGTAKAADPAPIAPPASTAAPSGASAPSAVEPSADGSDRASAAGAEGDARTSDEARERRDARSGHRNARTWGYVSLALGATAGLVAIGTSVVMLEALGERNRDCNASKVCSSDGLSANTLLSKSEGWNTGSWIVTAVGLGVGAFLLITNPAESEATPSETPAAKPTAAIGVAPLGSGVGLSAVGSF
jgi:hypothetical protein